MIILSEGTTVATITDSRTMWQMKTGSSNSAKGGARSANWPNSKGQRLRCFKITKINLSRRLKRQPQWISRADLWSHRILSDVQRKHLTRIDRKIWFTETKLSINTSTYRQMSSGSMTHLREMMANLSNNKCIIIRIRHSHNHSKCLDDQAMTLRMIDFGAAGGR